MCVLSLASPNVTDEKISNLLTGVPRRSIILIEDIDAFFDQRQKTDSGVKVSYSGFINALDGVASHEGSVVFLTTNHPERVDEAAIRSGRVDVRMQLGLCDRDQLARMFAKFFDDPAGAAAFASAVDADMWSPAQVQERLLKASTAEQAVALFNAAAPLRRAA